MSRITRQVNRKMVKKFCTLRIAIYHIVLIKYGSKKHRQPLFSVFWDLCTDQLIESAPCP